MRRLFRATKLPFLSTILTGLTQAISQINVSLPQGREEGSKPMQYPDKVIRQIGFSVWISSALPTS